MDPRIVERKAAMKEIRRRRDMKDAPASASTQDESFSAFVVTV